MTTLVFREKGYRRLTSPNILPTVLDYIKNTDMESDVTLDLRGCVFSYPLSKILEAVVDKLGQQEGEKTITISHGYSTATKNHLIPYLTKKTVIFTSGITTLEELVSALKITHKIEIKIVGPENE